MLALGYLKVGKSDSEECIDLIVGTHGLKESPLVCLADELINSNLNLEKFSIEENQIERTRLLVPHDLSHLRGLCITFEGIDMLQINVEKKELL